MGYEVMQGKKESALKSEAESLTYGEKS